MEVTPGRDTIIPVTATEGTDTNRIPVVLRSGRPREERTTRGLLVAGWGIGGYQEILSIHAEGSLAAQRITILRDYDVKRCVEIVKSYLKD